MSNLKLDQENKDWNINTMQTVLRPLITSNFKINTLLCLTGCWNRGVWTEQMCKQQPFQEKPFESPTWDVRYYQASHRMRGGSNLIQQWKKNKCMNTLTLMPDETQSTSLCVSIAAALEKAAGGSSPDPGILDTGSLDTPPQYSDSSSRKQFWFTLPWSQ